MAIEKDIENEYGAQFNYHKLREVRVINSDDTGVQLTLTVQSWIDKQARIDGKQPTTRQCIIMAADFAMTPFYALLKAKFDEFTAGEDDFDNSFKEQPEEESKTPEFFEQTGQGQLLRKWKEVDPEVTEEAAEEQQPEVQTEDKEADDAEMGRS